MEGCRARQRPQGKNTDKKPQSIPKSAVAPFPAPLQSWPPSHPRERPEPASVQRKEAAPPPSVGGRLGEKLEAPGAGCLPEFDSRESVAAGTCVGTGGRPRCGCQQPARAHRAPPPPHPPVRVGVPVRLGLPQAGGGNRTPVCLSFVGQKGRHLQSEVGQQAGGFHRRRGFLGQWPPCPQSREKMWAVPRVESQRSQGLFKAQVFRGERRRDRGRGGEREGGGGGGGGGGRNWETEV